MIATARGQILNVVDGFALLSVGLDPAPAGPKFTTTGGPKSLDETQSRSIVNAIRDLFTQQPVGTDIWIALAWCVGILIVAYIFAMITYRRKIS